MRENCSKHPSIKLFGKKIPLTNKSDRPLISDQEFRPLMIADEEDEKAENKDFSAAKSAEITLEEEKEEEEDAKIQATKECLDSETSTESNVKPNTPPVNEESTKSKTSKAEKEENDEENSKNTLKKPDKIRPCPRCNSMDTKFCYYNNYNINQPRHFCRACQRYWTAGGTMRNVPVGAGRRKNKNSASHYRYITISEALQAARTESSNGTLSPALKTNSRVLSFRADSPLCNSMASVFSLVDKKPMNGTRNSFRQVEEHWTKPASCKGRENGDDCSSGSSVTVSNSIEDGGRNCSQDGYMQRINEFASPIPCFPGVPWPYQLPSPPPGFCPPGFPLQFYPPIWNCGGWNFPLLSPQSSTNEKAPTLGKHSRNGETVKPYESEKHEPEKRRNGCVLVPKILRIDDPNEAAKSSIWTTLGIKNESLNGEKLFKAFQSKTKEKNNITEASPVLMANPAALSRSMNFRESS